MNAGEHAQYAALVLLKEIAGVTNITESDPGRMKALAQQVGDAAKDAGTTMQALLTAVVHGLERTDPALFHRVKRVALGLQWVEAA